MTAGRLMPGRAGTILLVEDSADDARLIREALREANPAHAVSRVADGEEALDFLYRRPPYTDVPRPDLILLDLNLPRKTGREVLVEIKGSVELRCIPVSILTTSAAPQDIRDAYDAHVNAYLRKPVGFGELANMIGALDAFWFNTNALRSAPDGT